MDYITEKSAIYVTSAVNHACSLAHMNCEAYLAEGKLKGATEAIVGVETMEMLSQYNFTKEALIKSSLPQSLRRMRTDLQG